MYTSSSDSIDQRYSAAFFSRDAFRSGSSLFFLPSERYESDTSLMAYPETLKGSFCLLSTNKTGSRKLLIFKKSFFLFKGFLLFDLRLGAVDTCRRVFPSWNFDQNSRCHQLTIIGEQGLERLQRLAQITLILRRTLVTATQRSDQIYSPTLV